MILTSLTTKNIYPKYPNAIIRAIAWLEENQMKIPTMATGEYPIESTQMFAKVFDVATKNAKDTKPELHKKYIDVQYWSSGEEMMGYAPNTGNYIICEENTTDDLYFLSNVDNEIFIPASVGDIMVLFPEDIHRPAISKKSPVSCRKVVIKVSVELL